MIWTSRRCVIAGKRLKGIRWRYLHKRSGWPRPDPRMTRVLGHPQQPLWPWRCHRIVFAPTHKAPLLEGKLEGLTPAHRNPQIVPLYLHKLWCYKRWAMGRFLSQKGGGNTDSRLHHKHPCVTFFIRQRNAAEFHHNCSNVHVRVISTFDIWVWRSFYNDIHSQQSQSTWINVLACNSGSPWQYDM